MPPAAAMYFIRLVDARWRRPGAPPPTTIEIPLKCFTGAELSRWPEEPTSQAADVNSTWFFKNSSEGTFYSLTPVAGSNGKYCLGGNDLRLDNIFMVTASALSDFMRLQNGEKSRSLEIVRRPPPEVVCLGSYLRFTPSAPGLRRENQELSKGKVVEYRFPRVVLKVYLLEGVVKRYRLKTTEFPPTVPAMELSYTCSLTCLQRVEDALAPYLL